MKATYLQKTLFIAFLCTLAGLTISSTSSSQSVNLQPQGIMKLSSPVRYYENESNYIVAIASDGIVYARNGQTGDIEFSDTDAGLTINYAINALPTEGGQIFIKAGIYSVNTRVDLVDKTGITITGTDDTVLVPSSTTILIDGNSSIITLQRLTIDGQTTGSKGINIKYGKDIRIIDCKIMNLLESGIQGHIHEDYATLLENIWINRCKISSVQLGNTTKNYAGIWMYGGQNVFIENNLVELCGSTGINLARCTGQAIITGNVVRDNDVNIVDGHGHGIYIGSNLPYSSRVIIAGNHVTGNGGNGIEAGSGDGVKGMQYVITGNVCSQNGTSGSGATHNGIYITGSRHVVTSNVCENNGGSGIQLGFAELTNNITIQGNTIGNNNVAGNTNGLWSSGISATGPDVSLPDDQLIVIRDNVIYEDGFDPAGGNQQRGIYIEDGADGFLITGNRIDGHPDDAIEWSPSASNIIVRQNYGFRTEAVGEAVDSSPSGTSGYILLDLSSELDVDDVVGTLVKAYLHVTPIVPPGGTYPSGGYFNYWVAQNSGTEFRIYWECAAIPPEVAFSWIYGRY